MSDSSRPLPEDSPYCPVSGLAAAGFGLALLFALGMAAVGGLALWKGTPLVLPALLYAVPLLAFVLSLLGLLHIRRSEGARAGTPLAQWGMALALLFGGGYLAWGLVKEDRIKADAQSFTVAWLERLGASKPDVDSCVAFWNTLDLEQRQRDTTFPLDRPQFEKLLRDDPAKLEKYQQDYLWPRFAFGAGDQKLPAFGAHELVQFLRYAQTDVRLEPKGVRSWAYRPQGDGAYLVEQNYRLTTAEGSFAAVIVVLGGRRLMQAGAQWQVLMERTELMRPEPTTLTILGQNVVLLREDSREFARDWAAKLARGQYAEAYLDVRPAADRPALRQQTRFASLLGCFGMVGAGQDCGGGLLLRLALLDGEAVARLAWPGYFDFGRGNLVVQRNLLMDPASLEAVLRQSRALFEPQGTHTLGIEVALPGAYPLSPWEMKGGQAVFRQPLGLTLSGYRCAGWLLIATNDPALLAGLTPATNIKLTVPPAQRPFRWRVIGLELTVGTIVEAP